MEFGCASASTGCGVAPAFTLSIVAADPVHPENAQDISVTWNGPTPVTIALSLNDAPVALWANGGTYHWDPGDLADGAYVFRATISGSYPASASMTFVLDRGPPNISPLGGVRTIAYSGLTDLRVVVDRNGLPTVGWTLWNAPVLVETWAGGAWGELPPLGSSGSFYFDMIAARNGDLVVAWEVDIKSIPVARLDAGTWESLGVATPVGTTGVLWPNLAQAGTDVEVALGITFVPGPIQALVVRWDGSAWQPFGPALGGVNSTPLLSGELDDVGVIAAIEQSDSSGHRYRIDRWTKDSAEQLTSIDAANVYLRGIVSTGRGRVVALVQSVSAPVLHVLSWEGTAWQELGAGFTTDGLVPSGQGFSGAALVARPDGGLGLLYSEPGASAVDIVEWDGRDWTRSAGPLRALSGHGGIGSAALAYDALGRPTAAWTVVKGPMNRTDGEQSLVVW